MMSRHASPSARLTAFRLSNPESEVRIFCLKMKKPQFGVPSFQRLKKKFILADLHATLIVLSFFLTIPTLKKNTSSLWHFILPKNAPTVEPVSQNVRSTQSLPVTTSTLSTQYHALNVQDMPMHRHALPSALQSASFRDKLSANFCKKRGRYRTGLFFCVYCTVTGKTNTVTGKTNSPVTFPAESSLFPLFAGLFPLRQIS